MRREPGDLVRLFNGRDGEWLGEIEALGKKDGRVLPLEQVKVQPVKAPEVHLIFTPLQKNRLDFLVEKAAELGATALHPVLTARTEHRKINEERAGLQLIEASEQCERLDIPVLHPLEDLKAKMVKWSVDTPVFWGPSAGRRHRLWRRLCLGMKELWHFSLDRRVDLRRRSLTFYLDFNAYGLFRSVSACCARKQPGWPVCRMCWTGGILFRFFSTKLVLKQACT